ncbi:hypothetical protein EW146_g2329 [Bondarzewia mesenterica]|uniref:Uncharacterized protein n=1 Tax=Bondarzewia mesenterica TaxID=1095465 RepID=A0A4S4M781_9AGAM|nr:hypothetical protein EW146_g2329 [Bondarzewia mesenterica]
MQFTTLKFLVLSISLSEALAAPARQWSSDCSTSTAQTLKETAQVAGTTILLNKPSATVSADPAATHVNINAPAATSSPSIIKLNRRQLTSTESGFTTSSTFSFGGIVPSFTTSAESAQSTFSFGGIVPSSSSTVASVANETASATFGASSAFVSGLTSILPSASALSSSSAVIASVVATSGVSAATSGAGASTVTATGNNGLPTVTILSTVTVTVTGAPGINSVATGLTAASASVQTGLSSVPFAGPSAITSTLSGTGLISASASFPTGVSSSVTQIGFSSTLTKSGVTSSIATQTGLSASPLPSSSNVIGVAEPSSKSPTAVTTIFLNSPSAIASATATILSTSAKDRFGLTSAAPAEATPSTSFDLSQLITASL